MKTLTRDEIKEKWHLEDDFLDALEAKVIDKENYQRAVRMFAHGTLPYDMATGDEPLNVAEYRKKVAKMWWDERKRQREILKKVNEYLLTCKVFRLCINNGQYETCYIKDGRIVALGYMSKKNWGLHMADIPDILPEWRWNPKLSLALFRKWNRSFFWKVKEEAHNSPREWFRDLDKVEVPSFKKARKEEEKRRREREEKRKGDEK